jgi:hypothetical protein
MSSGSGFGAWSVRIVVSGRERDLARFMNGAWVSPRPWRRSRIFGGVLLFDWGGGGVSVSVREEGKSDFWGVRVGILG